MIRAVALIAILALVAGAPCYGNCAVSGYGPPPTPSSGCHHHKSSHEHPPICVHQLSDVTGPEAGMAKSGVAKSAPAVAVLTADSTASLMQPQVPMPQGIGSPPDRLSSHPIFALRI